MAADDPVAPTAASPRGGQGGRAYRLTVTDGPSAGAEVEVSPLRGGALLVGRHPAAALVIADPSVSGRHAELRLGGPTPRLVDLGSRNGTWVNGVRVADAFVDHGDVLRFGDALVAVRRLDPGEGDEPLPDAFGALAGQSPSMRRVFALCERLAASDVSVVIGGETGTGKEVVAEALHRRGRRAGGPFVVFDCTATPPTLLESALFGHEKGAFTGAVAAHRGVFEQADGGTLLIDEIGDLDVALQATLLRAIERAEVRRVGGDRWLRADVRVLATTRRDLRKAATEGRFRDDLYYRLAVARVELPPLRARAGDVELLARQFWRELGGDGDLPARLLERYRHYPWPGNVRQLRNAVARAIALGDLDEFDGLVEDERGERPDGERPFFDVVDEVLRLALPLPEAREHIVAEFERRYLEQAVREADGHLGRAAARAGVSSRYFRLLRARLTAAPSKAEAPARPVAGRRPGPA